ncbi:hypothetical protein SK128_007374 [Halocaridina rubra]|uniref:Uncharacterized protein n=1 Tax=Halocaridina rubra TaxID=373956 RepID=A0AAN9A552_HALRR
MTQQEAGNTLPIILFVLSAVAFIIGGTCLWIKSETPCDTSSEYGTYYEIYSICWNRNDALTISGTIFLTLGVALFITGFLYICVSRSKSTKAQPQTLFVRGQSPYDLRLQDPRNRVHRIRPIVYEEEYPKPKAEETQSRVHHIRPTVYEEEYPRPKAEETQSRVHRIRPTVYEKEYPRPKAQHHRDFVRFDIPESFDKRIHVQEVGNRNPMIEYANNSYPSSSLANADESTSYNERQGYQQIFQNNTSRYAHVSANQRNNLLDSDKPVPLDRDTPNFQTQNFQNYTSRYTTVSANPRSDFVNPDELMPLERVIPSHQQENFQNQASTYTTVSANPRRDFVNTDELMPLERNIPYHKQENFQNHASTYTTVSANPRRYFVRTDEFIPLDTDMPRYQQQNSLNQGSRYTNMNANLRSTLVNTDDPAVLKNERPDYHPENEHNTTANTTRTTNTNAAATNTAVTIVSRSTSPLIFDGVQAPPATPVDNLRSTNYFDKQINPKNNPRRKAVRFSL